MSLTTMNDTSNTSDSDTLTHSDESDPCSSQTIQISKVNLISRGKPQFPELIAMATILDGTFLN